MSLPIRHRTAFPSGWENLPFSSLFEKVRLRSGNLLDRPRRTMQCNGALVTLLAEFLVDLQEERAVAERDATVDAFSATDAQVLVDHIFEVRRLNRTADNRSGRTQLVLRSGMSRNWLRIEKARTKVAVSTHLEIVETFDRRNGQDATVSATAAADTTLRINLPGNGVACRLFPDGEVACCSDDPDRRRAATDRFQKFTPLCVHPGIILRTPRKTTSRWELPGFPKIL